MEPHLGSGSGAGIAGLARGLRALGHSVHMVGASPAGLGTLGRLRYNLAVARQVASEVADAALVVGFDMDGFALVRRPRPYAVCLKGIMADELRFERGWTRLRFRLLSRLEAANARSADVVTVTSEYCRGLAIESYGLDPARVRIVPEGIDLESWSRTGPTHGIPDPGGAETASPPLVLSVARQYRRKNTVALLRAMPDVSTRSPGARLRIVGGGPELARLERERQALGLRDVVEILGELPGLEAVRAEYRRADIFCLPSLQEGFGIAFLEAMASGLPVVACWSAAVPEIVLHGETGLLVPPGDPAALADALVRLLDDPALRRRLGEAGRRHAEGYAWETVARRFLAAAGF